MSTTTPTCRTCKTPISDGKNPQRIYCSRRCRGIAAKAREKARHAHLDGLDSPEALTGGRWVLDRQRRVQVWEASAEPTLDPADRQGPGRPAMPRVCGTERGYQQHRHAAKRGGETWPLPDDDPCGCKAAHAAHEAFRYAQQREGRRKIEEAA